MSHLHALQATAKAPARGAYGARGGARKPRQSRSMRAGLLFPVARVHRKLKQQNVGDRVGAGEQGNFTGMGFGRRIA